MKNEKIKDTIYNISKNLSNLDNEKNLAKIVKKYNKNNTEIKYVQEKICELKQEFENCITMPNIINLDDINEKQYQIYYKELCENTINEIINNGDLELQIEEYKKNLEKINYCKKYLESIKIKIINCDNNNDFIQPDK
jgi:hypothetical protein